MLLDNTEKNRAAEEMAGLRILPAAETRMSYELYRLKLDGGDNCRIGFWAFGRSWALLVDTEQLNAALDGNIANIIKDESFMNAYQAAFNRKLNQVMRKTNCDFDAAEQRASRLVRVEAQDIDSIATLQGTEIYSKEQFWQDYKGEFYGELIYKESGETAELFDDKKTYFKAVDWLGTKYGGVFKERILDYGKFIQKAVEAVHSNEHYISIGPTLREDYREVVKAIGEDYQRQNVDQISTSINRSYETVYRWETKHGIPKEQRLTRDDGHIGQILLRDPHTLAEVRQREDEINRGIAPEIGKKKNRSR